MIQRGLSLLRAYIVEARDGRRYRRLRRPDCRNRQLSEGILAAYSRPNAVTTLVFAGTSCVVGGALHSPNECAGEVVALVAGRIEAWCPPAGRASGRPLA